MNFSSILSPVDSPSLPAAPLDAVWLFCIASYGCGAGGYPSRHAAIGLFQSGAAVPALSPWGTDSDIGIERGEPHKMPDHRDGATGYRHRIRGFSESECGRGNRRASVTVDWEPGLWEGVTATIG